MVICQQTLGTVQQGQGQGSFLTPGTRRPNLSNFFSRDTRTRTVPIRQMEGNPGSLGCS